MVLADSNDESVHLVVDLHQGGALRRAHCRGGMSCPTEPRFELWLGIRGLLFLIVNGGPKRLLEQVSNVLVVSFLRQNSVAI
jgi:hypothetical protein